MKYTREQLQAMAQQALQARDAGDLRYLDLVLSLAVAFQIDPNEVQRRIQALAETVKEAA